MGLFTWEKGPQRSHRRSHSRRHIQPRDAGDYRRERRRRPSLLLQPWSATCGSLCSGSRVARRGADRPVNGRHRHAPDAEGGHGRPCGNNPECRPALRTMYLGQQLNIGRARGVSTEVIQIFHDAMGDGLPGRAESKRPRPWWAATSLSC